MDGRRKKGYAARSGKNCIPSKPASTKSENSSARKEQKRGKRNGSRCACLTVNRARQFGPWGAKRVLARWTKDAIDASRSTTQKRGAAATRRDISTGAAPTHRTSKLSVKDVRSGGKLANLSDREILDL